MTNLKLWLLAIRPKTLTASIAPVILGVCLSYHLNGDINFPIAVSTLLCALFLQISTNLVNDYYDGKRGTDTNDRLGPIRVTQANLISPNKVKSAFIITFVISFFLGIYLMLSGGVPIIVIGLCSILFAYIYTGGPLPLSHYALGEILAFIFFGPVAVWGAYFLQSKTHHNLAILVGCGPGFIAAALMAINNLRDQKNDKVANKITIAVLVGESNSRLLPLLFIAFSIAVPIVFFNIMKSPTSILLVCLTPFIFINSWQNIFYAEIDSKMNESLAATGKFLFIYCIIFSISLVNPYI